MRRLTGIASALLLVCSAQADEEEFRTVLKQLVTGTVHEDASQAVEKASEERFYDVLRLALWAPVYSVRTEAGERIRQAPITEQAKIWRDFLLDDSRWDWSQMNRLEDNAQASIRNMMMVGLSRNDAKLRVAHCLAVLRE